MLIDLAPADAAVGEYWRLLSNGAEIDEVLDALVTGGVRSLPDFAIAQLDVVGGRVAVRGRGTVRIDESPELSAPSGTPWFEEELAAESQRRVVLAGPSARSTNGAALLPMSAGVTFASQVIIELSGSVPEPRPRHDAPRPTPRSLASTGVSAPPPVPGLPQASVPLAESVQSALAESLPDESETSDVVELSHQAAEAPPTQESSEEPAQELAADDGPLEESYDHLFGATQRPVPIEDLAVPQADDEPHPVPHSVPASPLADRALSIAELGPVIDTLPPPTATLMPGQHRGLEPEQSPRRPTELIDSVPWQSGPTTAASVTPGELDLAKTTNRAALRAPIDPSVVSVVAVRCVNGHLTPTDAATCRVCRSPVPVSEGMRAPRPPLGVLRLSTGASVALDRNVLIGRAPAAKPGSTEQAHLVQVASPENDISRTHAEIVLDGWHVLVRDLDSTNGTTVTLPGQEPVRLRAGDPQLLEPGAIITLADELECTFEVTL